MGRSPRHPPTPPPDPSESHHLATVPYEGRFWDVYLEFVDDPRRPDRCRGLLVFSAADGEEEEEPARTTPIFIEDSFEKVLERARGLEQRDLVGFLRSVLP